MPMSAESDGFRAGSFPPTSHRAASFYDRDVSGWRPRAGSADADLLPELYQLRNRARDIDRNNGVAKGGIQTIVDNVVGSGLRLAARPVYKALGKDKAWADEWSAQVQAEWQAYAWTTACHAGDTLTFDQLTAQALRSELTNGDALATMLWLPGGAYATKIQTIESDRLSNPNGEMDGPNLRGGVKLDANGAPVGYWIRNAHPGDAYMAGMYWSYPQWELVPRYTSFGRLRVLHVFDPQRSGQNRGKPILTAVLSQFKQADRYVNAEIMAAVVNAMVAGIITTPMAAEDIKDLFDNDARREEWFQIRRDHAVKMENGGILPLAPGDDFKSHLPQRPAAQFGTFMTNVYRIIACGLDIPYELLLKDFSQTNYSSARAAMLEAWRSFNRRRDWLGTQWCDPIYWNFLEEKVNDGTIDAPGFYENRAAYQRCKWIGPGRGWVDPVKEAMAAQIRIDSGVSTLEDECAEQGKDWEEVMEQRATELTRAKDLNIPQVVSGRATIVPEDASNAPGVDTPGAAPPSNGAPSSGAFGNDQLLFSYRMEVPGDRAASAYARVVRAERERTERSLSELRDQIVKHSESDEEKRARQVHDEKLLTAVLAVASRPQPQTELRIEPGAIASTVTVVQPEQEQRGEADAVTHVSPIQPAPIETATEIVQDIVRDANGRVAKVISTHRTADGNIVKRSIKEVVERDADEKISKVRET